MSQIPTVTSTDVANDAIILDIREAHEWAAGHAPGAVHIPMGDLPARLGELSELPGLSVIASSAGSSAGSGAGSGAHSGPLAVICRSGARSARVVAWLTQQGYDVANLDGGMLAWQAAGKPMVADGGVTPDVR